MTVWPCTHTCLCVSVCVCMCVPKVYMSMYLCIRSALLICFGLFILQAIELNLNQKDKLTQNFLYTD